MVYNAVCKEVFVSRVTGTLNLEGLRTEISSYTYYLLASNEQDQRQTTRLRTHDLNIYATADVARVD